MDSISKPQAMMIVARQMRVLPRNIKENRLEWFEKYSAPYTIGIGFEQWIPEEEVLFPTYYAVRFKDSSTNDRWLQFIILKSLESKEKKSND